MNFSERKKRRKQIMLKGERERERSKKEEERERTHSFFIISTIILSPRVISVRSAAFIIGRKDVGIPQ